MLSDFSDVGSKDLNAEPAVSVKGDVAYSYEEKHTLKRDAPSYPCMNKDRFETGPYIGVYNWAHQGCRFQLSKPRITISLSAVRRSIFSPAVKLPPVTVRL